MQTGGRLRVGKMLRALARTDEIDLAVGLALAEGGAASYEVPEWLGDLGKWKAIATRSRPRCHRFLSIFSLRPYLASWYHIAELGDLAQQWSVSVGYDVVVAEHSYTLPAALRVAECPAAVIVHNLEENRYRSLAEARRGFRRAGARLEAVKMTRLERRCLARCDGAVTVSREDERRLRETGFRGVLATIPNGADLDPFDRIPPASEADHVIFCGTLGYAPNVQAARFLAGLWPIVRQRRRGATLLLVGRAPSPEVLALSDRSAGIHVIPDVPDVAPYYACAGVVAVPIFQGGGASLKLMEAFAAGRPVVATPRAADAYELGPAPFVHRASSPEEFVNQIVRLLEDPGAREEMGRQAAAYARNHTWDVAARQLRDFLSEVARSR